MVDKADIADVIQKHRQKAAEALEASQLGAAFVITLAGLAVAAEAKGNTLEDEAADTIVQKGLADKFVRALQARGIRIDAPQIDPALSNWKDVPLARLGACRCRILVDGQPTGSGCLIGPSLALTAWHVVAVHAPDQPNPLGKKIEVEFEGGLRLRATYKRGWTCTVEEYAGQMPKAEQAFNGFHDVAILQLERPEGMRIGFVPLALPTPALKPHQAIALLHFPNGANVGQGFGTIAKIRGLQARWQHTVATDGGSSGGPCFNNRMSLVGLHQGRWPPHGRIVPSHLFIGDLQPIVEQDIAPLTMWSLDGTPDGQLVIGRDLLFEAIAAAVRPASRVRGVRVKRLDIDKGTVGLAFTFQVVQELLTRNPGVHTVIRLDFQPPFTDLLNSIRDRARARGWTISDIAGGAGARAGETTVEAAINDRARTLAAELNAEAMRRQQFLWVMFESPPVGLGDAERFAFEGFVDAALRQSHLRLVIAGFETITIAGEEFPNARAADSDGGPGLVVEYFGAFHRRDVEDFLRRAAQSYGLDLPADAIKNRVDEILLNLNVMHEEYAVEDLKTVAERAVSHLRFFRDKAGGQQ